MAIYWFILLNAHALTPREMHKYLKELEFLCMARHLRKKFKDPRPLSAIVKLIIKEFGSAGLYPQTCRSKESLSKLV